MATDQLHTDLGRKAPILTIVGTLEVTTLRLEISSGIGRKKLSTTAKHGARLRQSDFSYSENIPQSNNFANSLYSDSQEKIVFCL